MIGDFLAPSVPEGWLELDGSSISSTTYSALYTIMTVQQSGTRISGNSIIASLSSTSNIKAGYYVIGTGISAGTTVVSVDSSSQITISTTATSSGTSTVIVSPWYLGTGSITLPDVSTAGRYRRSRTSTSFIGTLQDSQNKAHTHSAASMTATGTTGTESAGHTHTFSGTTSGESATHAHTFSAYGSTLGVGGTGYLGDSNGSGPSPRTSSVNTADHTHTYAGTTSSSTGSHTHAGTFTVSGATDSSGSSEARPTTLVVLTCVKT